MKNLLLFKIKNSQKGATLYFTLVIMTILLSAVFAINSLIISQIKAIKEAGDSVIAFYGADTGAERTLYEGKTGTPTGSPYKDTLSNGAYYEANAISTTSPSCSGQWYCIESVGVFQNTQRRIKITR